MQEPKSWNEKVITEILSSKVVTITSVNDYELIQSLLFDRDNYSSIVTLIKEKNWDKIKSIVDKENEGFREYLYLIKFSNQDNQTCVATVYDSDELLQDPEIINIFLLN